MEHEGESDTTRNWIDKGSERFENRRTRGEAPD